MIYNFYINLKFLIIVNWYSQLSLFTINSVYISSEDVCHIV